MFILVLIPWEDVSTFDMTVSSTFAAYKADPLFRVTESIVLRIVYRSDEQSARSSERDEGNKRQLNDKDQITAPQE